MTTPALWISGAPGTGKTTTGWRVFELLIAAGANAAYVDIDQLGLLGPFERLSGAAPHVVKAENARRLVGTLARLGLRQMVISGIVDPDLGDPVFADAPADSGIDLTHVRLRCAWPELRRRYLDRGSPPDALADLEELAARLDRSAADTVDTTSRDVDDVARELVARRATARTAPWATAPSARAAPLPTTVLHGATAAGKSTVGWELVRRRWAAGRATAYIDVEQLGFHGPAYHRDVHAAAYAALTRGYANAGADDLIVVTRDPDLVDEAHPEGLTRVLLDASDEALTTRVALRSAESTGRLPGDQLLGAAPAHQRILADRAHREAALLRRSPAHHVAIDATKGAPSDVVDRIERALGDRPGGA
ncbi:AAA family ATPase [Tsukamurella sp. M9C]|uniref:AAA family ATPase n=1 Tax=Tsukamurella sp. M9C TaxID=2877520 RepID=UPI001CC90309|nr:AAA family ATPase [Tsukamurella sp. M9C]MCA0156300.1 AAA family ATPase [Tsukamurella sp. M9C]